jgi:hypothetical protein
VGRDVNKDQLWKLVEMTVSEHSMERVLDALMHFSKQGAQAMRDHAAKINIQKDAEKLR